MPAKKKPAPRRSRASEQPSERLLNRELSWLAFNARVLHEGLSPATPVAERLGFLSIVSGNFDEFFMVRVGGLKQQAASDEPRRCPAGMTPAEQLEAISRRAHQMVVQQYRCLHDDLMPALARREILRLRPESLEHREAQLVARYFADEVFPSLTPVAVPPGEPFPDLAGLTLHVVARVRPEGSRDEPGLALLAIPRGWPRFFPLPSETGQRFVLLEDVVRHHLEHFFPGHEVLESAVLRVTRNADHAVDEQESDDLVEAMEDVLRARKSGEPVRLELSADASPSLRGLLCERLGIWPEQDLYLVDGPLDLKPFLKLAGRLDGPGLRYPAFDPQPVSAFEAADTPWDAVREKDVLVHLPYESFRPVLDLLEAAADDPQVLAVKQTLYRTSPDSPIIAALERAARRGKQVTVLVELKARFDEAQNIAWARRLAEAGAQVVWGVVGLKTHAKLLLIVRREPDGTRRYVHLSTGNYNDATASRYEDVGLFTCDPEIGADASNFFNAVTGYSEPRDWRQLCIAPTGLRERLVQLIDREIGRSSPEDPGQITLKMNSFADREMAEHLYRASQAGVRVRLCVRGICCLRPGVRGMSQNVEVVSLVGRFLEHSRIFHFRNGGDEEVYCASADFMARNLDRRLEVMFPVRDEAARRRLVALLGVCFEDNQQAFRLKPDGSYERVVPRRGQQPRRAQETFMEEAIARAEASRLRRLAVFRPQGPGMAPGLRR